MIDASDDADLTEKLSIEGAPEPERLVTIDVSAMDWNCSKYIEPRFTEAEIAAMIVFLASDRASYTTGSTIDVSGGMLMR